MGKQRIIDELNRRKGNHISDIEVCDMEFNEVEIGHTNLLKKKEGKNLKGDIISFCFTGLLTGVFLFGGIGIFLNNDINEVLVPVGIFILFGVLFLFFSIKSLIRAINNGVKKCQYAIVTGKYEHISNTNNSTHHDYYLEVILEGTGKRYAEVNCTKREYSDVVANDRILVVSFDNETADACLLS